MDLSRLPLFNKLALPPREVAAYLLCGIWNTLFGLGLYALVCRICGGRFHYMLLAVPVNIAAITNAFLCYKLFVFRTKGNWLKEYCKCYIVYGGGTLAGMGLLWLFVTFLHLDPAVANVFSTGVVVVAGYFGHKYFSFRNKQKAPKN